MKIDSRGRKPAATLALLLLVPAPSVGVFMAMWWEPTRGTAIGQAIYGLTKVWILTLPAIWLLAIDKGRLSFSPAKKGGLLTGLILGAAIAAVIGVSYLCFGATLIDAEEMRAAAERNGIARPPAFLALVLYLTFINSLMEEYVWRWFVFRKCEVLVGGISAVFFSALFFAGHHLIALKAQTGWSATLLASLGILLGACAWSWCYLRYRSIWPGYISHLIVDAAVFAIGWHVMFALS